jgi:hypothetical protein
MANEFVTRRGIISLGGITFPYYSTTTAYTVTNDDYFVDCLSGTFSVALPDSLVGKIFIVKNSGTGLITVDPFSGQTIDGLTTKNLAQNDSICVIGKSPDSSGWSSFGGSGNSGSGTSGTSGYSGLDGIGVSNTSRGTSGSSGVSSNVISKTASYTINTGDQIIIADATISAFTLTLPAAFGSTGSTFTVKRINSGSNNVTIVATSSEYIDGPPGTSAVIKVQYQSLNFVSDGSNWYII